MNSDAREIGNFLEEHLRANGTGALIFYSDLVDRFGLPKLTDAWAAHPLCGIFEALDEEDGAHGRPFRTAIVVARSTYRPGDGFYKMYAKLRNPMARFRTDEERMTIHVHELQELAKHYGPRA